jgi:hypothetical protein
MFAKRPGTTRGECRVKLTRRSRAGQSGVLDANVGIPCCSGSGEKHVEGRFGNRRRFRVQKAEGGGCGTVAVEVEVAWPRLKGGVKPQVANAAGTGPRSLGTSMRKCNALEAQTVEQQSRIYGGPRCKVMSICMWLPRL